MATLQYCEYGGTTKKCEEWLEREHEDLHERLYSEEALTAGLSTLSVDAQKRAEKDAQKKAAKASAAEARESEKRAASKIVIKRVERNKRKFVTEISGLEAFGLDLKKTAKEFGKKFATGSSVTKTAAGGEEITVQGDVSEDVVDWLAEHHEEIPEDNIELIEDKKKKAAPP
jgi:density-regulated protein DRP1